MERNRILIADAHLTMMAGVRLLLKDTFEVSVMVADHDSLQDTVQSGRFDLAIADPPYGASSTARARILRRAALGTNPVPSGGVGCSIRRYLSQTCAQEITRDAHKSTDYE